MTYEEFEESIAVNLGKFEEKDEKAIARKIVEITQTKGYM